MQCACTHSFKSLPTYHPPWHLHDLRFRVYSKLYGSECSRLNNRGKMNWPILLLLVWGTHYNFFVIIAWQATAYVNNMNALFNDIFACFSIYYYYIILVCILFFTFCFRSTSTDVQGLSNEWQRGSGDFSSKKLVNIWRKNIRFERCNVLCIKSNHGILHGYCTL